MQGTLNSAGLTVAIAARGAEIRSVRDRSGHEWMWQGGTLWPQRAPILFPVIGRPGGDSLRLGGVDYPIPQHGLAHSADFAMAEGGDGLTFKLRSSPATRGVFPFDFTLTVAFRVVGTTLHQSVAVMNPGDLPLPVQVGLHPGFRLPPGGDGPPLVAFETEEADTVRQLRRAQAGEIRPSPVRGRVLALDPDPLDGGAILFERVASRRVWYGRQGGRGVAVEFGGFPSLALWTKSVPDWLCIEPWQGLPDAGDFDGPLTARQQLAVIPPGEALRLTVAMTFGVPGPEWLSE